MVVDRLEEGGEVGLVGVSEVVMVGGSVSKGEVNGRALSAKTSPERRMGTRVPKVEVRISRALRLIGVLEGVDRVRGWMVSQSMCRSWSGPRTVLMKSIVFLAS
jgi:hypothetical protein